MGHCRLQATLLTVIMACGLLAGYAADATAREVQLAGVRLGQHALHVFQVYGQPGGIVKGGDAAAPAAAQPGAGEMGAMPGAPGAAPGADMAGMPGGMMDMGMAGEAAGPGAAAQPTTAGAVGSWPGPAGGGVGQAPPGPNPFPVASIPDWAHPVWVPLQPEETLWVYRRGAIVLGFVMDRDGYVVSIAVAGEKWDGARTAMAAPNRTIKLGDDYRRVISRYGYPAQTRSYQRVDRTWAASQTLGGVVGAFGGIGNATRDLILHYGHDTNVEFLLQDMRVIRIHIWEPEARPPGQWAATGAGAAAGAGPGAGMEGEMMGMPGMPGMGAPGMPGMPGMP